MKKGTIGRLANVPSPRVRAGDVAEEAAECRHRRSRGRRTWALRAGVHELLGGVDLESLRPVEPAGDPK